MGASSIFKTPLTTQSAKLSHSIVVYYMSILYWQDGAGDSRLKTVKCFSNL